VGSWKATDVVERVIEGRVLGFYTRYAADCGVREMIRGRSSASWW
jgi:hypothetical protein